MGEIRRPHQTGHADRVAQLDSDAIFLEGRAHLAPEVEARRLRDRTGRSLANPLVGSRGVASNQLIDAAQDPRALGQQRRRRCSVTLTEVRRGEVIEQCAASRSVRDFERVSLAFRKPGELVAMELVDKLGQTTTIQFSDVRRARKLDDALFRFVPPAGADVIGEAAAS